MHRTGPMHLNRWDPRGAPEGGFEIGVHPAECRKSPEALLHAMVPHRWHQLERRASHRPYQHPDA
eukprot:10225440-Alexandrium_andersonii.AAC.1